MECFPPKAGEMQEGLLLALLRNIVLDVLAIAIRQKKKRNKRHTDYKEIKLLLALHNVIVHVANPRNVQILLELINEVSRFAVNKINTQKATAFPYVNEHKETKIKNIIPFRITPNKIKT